MAEDLTVPAGLTDYLVILWYNTLLDYDASFPLDFQALADAYNGGTGNLFFHSIEAIKIQSRADFITGTLEECREFCSMLATAGILSADAIANNLYLLTRDGIRRIEKYISESDLPHKATLLNDCKRLEELRRTFRETPVTDTIAAIVTHYPADEVGEYFALPKTPLAEIGFICVSAVTRDYFLKTFGGLHSRLAREIASQIETPRKPASSLLSKIERNLKDKIKPYRVFPELAGGITPTPAPDAADATAAKMPATDTGETVEAEPGAAAEFAAALADAGFTEVKGEHLRNDRNGGEPVEMKPPTKKLLIEILPYISEVKRKKATSDRWSRPDAVSSGIQSGRCENIVLEREGVQYMIIYVKCEIDRKEKYRFGVRIHERAKSGKMKSYTYQFFK